MFIGQEIPNMVSKLQLAQKQLSKELEVKKHDIRDVMVQTESDGQFYQVTTEFNKTLLDKHVDLQTHTYVTEYLAIYIRAYIASKGKAMYIRTYVSISRLPIS